MSSETASTDAEDADLRSGSAPCSVVYLTFAVRSPQQLVAMKRVKMPILPPGSLVWCFPVDGDEEPYNEISHYSMDERGRIWCHLKNEGFGEDEIPWLEDRGYHVE